MNEQIPELSGLQALEVEAPSHERLLERAAQRRRRRRARIGGAVALLACAVVAGGLISSSDESPLAPDVVEAAARLTLPGKTVGTDLSGDRLWVLTCQARCAKSDPQATLVEINSQSAEIERTISVNGAGAVAVGAGSVWIASFAESTVERIDPASGQVLATIPLTLPKPVEGGDDRLLPLEAVFGGDSLWVSGGRGYLARINPAQNAVETMYEIPPTAGELVVGDGRAWIGGGVDGVIEVDPVSGAVRSIPIEGADGRRLSVSGLSEIDGELWATGLWAQATTESGDHTAYVVTSEGALVKVGGAGAETRPVSLPVEGLGVSADAAGELLLTAKPEARAVYGYRPGAARIVPVAQLERAGALLEARDGQLWLGVTNRVVELYELDPAP